MQFIKFISNILKISVANLFHNFHVKKIYHEQFHQEVPQINIKKKLFFQPLKYLWQIYFIVFMSNNPKSMCERFKLFFLLLLLNALILIAFRGHVLVRLACQLLVHVITQWTPASNIQKPVRTIQIIFYYYCLTHWPSSHLEAMCCTGSNANYQCMWLHNEHLRATDKFYKYYY